MKVRRHAKILEIINQYDVDTQEELLQRLRESGFEATQATISRDIKALRLVKTLSPKGNYCYKAHTQEEPNMSSKFYSIFQESVVHMDYAGNILCIKCLTGMANAVCATLDSMHWDGVVGTLAGDDTIFVLLRTDESAAGLLTELKNLTNGR